MALIPAVYVTIEDKSFAMPNPGNGRYGLIPIISDRGPHNRVVEVNSQSEFYEIFGRPFFDRTGHGHYLADKFLQHSNRLLVVRPVLFPSTSEFEQTGEYEEEPFDLENYASISNIGVRYRNDENDSVDKINARNDENPNTVAFSYPIPFRYNATSGQTSYTYLYNVAAKTINNAEYADGKITYTTVGPAAHGITVGQTVTITGITIEVADPPVENPFNKEKVVVTAVSGLTFSVNQTEATSAVYDAGGSVESTELTDWLADTNNSTVTVNPVAYAYFEIGEYIVPYIEDGGINYFSTTSNNSVLYNSIARRIVDKIDLGGVHKLVLEKPLVIPIDIRTKLITDYPSYIATGSVSNTVLNRKVSIRGDIAEKYFSTSKILNHWCYFTFTNGSNEVKVDLNRNTILAILDDNADLIYESANYTHASVLDTELYTIASRLYNTIVSKIQPLNWIYPTKKSIDADKALIPGGFKTDITLAKQIVSIKAPCVVDSTLSGAKKYVPVNTLTPAIGEANQDAGQYTSYTVLKLVLDQPYDGETVTTLGIQRRSNTLMDVTAIPYLRDALNSTEYLSNLISNTQLSNFSATEDATAGGPSFNKEDLDYLWHFYAAGAGTYYNDLYLVGVRNINLEKMWVDEVEPEADPDTGKRNYESSTTYGKPIYKYAFMDLYLYRQNLDGTSTLLEGPWSVSLIRTTNTGQVIRDIYTGRELYIETVINELSKNIRCVGALGSNILLTGSTTEVPDPAYAETLRLNVLSLFSVDKVYKTNTRGYGGIRFDEGRDGAQYDSRGKINIGQASKMAGRVGQIFAGQLESPDGSIEKLRDTLYPQYQIDYVISAGWDPDTQAKAREFVDVRQDCMLLADTGKLTLNKSQDIVEKQRNDWNTWNAMVYTQYRRMFDSFTGKYLWMSPVYHAIERHLYCDSQYWIAEPVAGIEKGAIQDPIRLAYKASQTDLEDLLDYNLNPVIVEPEGTYILTQFTTWKRLSIMKRAHAVKFVHFVKKRLPPLLKDILQRKMTSYWVNLANQRINAFLSRYVDGANGISERYTAITSFSVEVTPDEARSELNILLTLKPIRAIEAINVHIVVV